MCVCVNEAEWRESARVLVAMVFYIKNNIGLIVDHGTWVNWWSTSLFFFEWLK